tara:strand:- start:965 stop:1270 length:306 start_codon:yes stop_codon:yes gene_type:complete
MSELFQKVDNIIWQELNSQDHIISYKRELQKMQIKLYSQIIYSNFSFPSDAIAFARQSLKNILKNIYINLDNPDLDGYTKSHLENSSEMIETILTAEIQIN